LQATADTDSAAAVAAAAPVALAVHVLAMAAMTARRHSREQCDLRTANQLHLHVLATVATGNDC